MKHSVHWAICYSKHISKVQADFCKGVHLKCNGFCSGQASSMLDRFVGCFALLSLDVAETRAAGELKQELHCLGMLCLRRCLAEWISIHPLYYHVDTLLCWLYIRRRWKLWCFLVWGVVFHAISSCYYYVQKALSASNHDNRSNLFCYTINLTHSQVGISLEFFLASLKGGRHILLLLMGLSSTPCICSTWLG